MSHWPAVRTRRGKDRMVVSTDPMIVMAVALLAPVVPGLVPGRIPGL